MYEFSRLYTMIRYMLTWLITNGLLMYEFIKLYISMMCMLIWCAHHNHNVLLMYEFIKLYISFIYTHTCLTIYAATSSGVYSLLYDAHWHRGGVLGAQSIRKDTVVRNVVYVVIVTTAVAITYLLNNNSW